MTISGVYFIRNAQTQKVYVGSSVDIYRRWKSHIYDLNRNAHHSTHLQNAWNAYGESTFEFLLAESASNDKDLSAVEQKWIHIFNAYENGYNCCPIAGNVGRLPKTEAHKRAIGDAHKGKKRSPQARANMSAAARKRSSRGPTSEETKKRISEAKKGWVMSPESRQRLSEAMKGKKRSK